MDGNQPDWASIQVGPSLGLPLSVLGILLYYRTHAMTEWLLL